MLLLTCSTGPQNSSVLCEFTETFNLQITKAEEVAVGFMKKVEKMWNFGNEETMAKQ